MPSYFSYYSNKKCRDKENFFRFYWLQCPLTDWKMNKSWLYFLSLIRNSARAVCGVTSLSDSDDATEFDLNQVIEVRKHWQKNSDGCVVQLRCDSAPKNIYQNRNYTVKYTTNILFKHPDYDFFTLENDHAILELTEVPDDANILAVFADDQGGDAWVGTECWITGWGEDGKLCPLLFKQHSTCWKCLSKFTHKVKK